jgi:hypothetical protein
VAEELGVLLQRRRELLQQVRKVLRAQRACFESIASMEIPSLSVTGGA